MSKRHKPEGMIGKLRRAQSLVAQTISMARAKYPNSPVKASKEIEARRQGVAIRIAKGDKIVVIQVRDIVQEQALQRDGRSR